MIQINEKAFSDFIANGNIVFHNHILYLFGQNILCFIWSEHSYNKAAFAKMKNAIKSYQIYLPKVHATFTSRIVDSPDLNFGKTTL